MARVILWIFWILFLSGICIAAALFVAGKITWWSLVIGSMFVIFASPFTVSGRTKEKEGSTSAR